MKNTLRTLISCGLVLLLTSSCGDKEKKDPDGENGVSINEVQGNGWASPCLANSTAYQGNYYEIRMVSFVSTKMKVEDFVYEDDKCNTDALMVITRESTYAATNPTKTLDTAANGVYNFDEFIRRFTVTPRTSKAVALLSSGSFCGITDDWKTGTATPVTGRICDNNSHPFETGTVFNKMKVNISSKPQSLMFGRFTATENGATSQKRPTQFNESEALHR